MSKDQEKPKPKPPEPKRPELESMKELEDKRIKRTA